MDTLKLCINCKNFEVLESGREFENIADTEYLLYRCRIQGKVLREDYLMKPPDRELTKENSGMIDCPYWEHWKKSGGGSTTRVPSR